MRLSVRFTAPAARAARPASLFAPSLVLSVLAALGFGRAAWGQDLGRTSIPNKWIEPLLPEELPALPLPAYVAKDPLAKARAEAFAGRYKLALLTLRKAPQGDAAEVALVRAHAQASLGKRAEATATLTEQAVAGEARVQVARARLLAETGKHAQALALLKEHLAKKPDSIAGHYYLGQISEEVGHTAAAREAYAFFEPFVDKWQGGGAAAFESAEEVTLIGRGLDRWASLNSLYQTRDALHKIILGMFVKAYDVIDRGYWPAHVAAAEYYLSHDDEEDAMKELKKANAANPRDVRSIQLLGQMMLGQFNFDATEKAIAGIKQIDPEAVEADLLSARNLLHQRRPREAEAPVRRVLEKYPNHVEALGLLAAAYALQLHDDQMEEALKQVEKIDPNNASTYLDVAEQLSAMRQYPRAAAKYKVAIERAPWWTAARNGLGLLYTQSGDEDDAAAVLEAAHALDPFNYATTNYLRLLDGLRKFARTETAHFVLMYDAQKDPLIPLYFADYLESIYKDVCGEYRCEPPVKTYIEVFPTHDAFSVRTTGSPWIGTVGASTGRVIAMVAPRKGENTLNTFNWAQVLRHEFTHTVTLAATDNRIAHWMTEGLAVVEERSPLRWEWVPMLYQAVKKHELFTLENLTWGFVRPKRPIDRQLAYAESFWICQYIETTYGHESILKMLEEFRKGKLQDEVFPMILKRSVSEFQEEFFDWTAKQTAAWGYDEQASKKVEELKKKGESQIKGHNYKEALKTWQEIGALRPVDALPHTRLAGLYLTKEINEPQKAIDHLVALHKVELKDNRYAKRVARLYRDLGQLEQALNFGLQAVYVDPYDLDAHELLASLYEKSGNTTAANREKEVIPVLQKWLEENRKKSMLPGKAE